MSVTSMRVLDVPREDVDLHLTDAGRDALRAADAVIAEIAQQITEKLGPEDTRLTTLLGQAADAVRES
jgi:DNA-binding MarR family transcriptional regulator